MDQTKVLFIIAFNGFEESEYTTTKHMVENAGFTVITASDKIGTAIAHNESTQTIDLYYDKAIPGNYSGIVFIGGPGCLEHLDNNSSYKIIHEAVAQHIPLGAISIATRIIAKTGTLKEKHATGWNEDNQLDQIYKEYQVKYMPNELVTIDDNIITAKDLLCAQKFGELFVQTLQKKQSWG